MNFKELEKTIAQLKNTDDEIAKIGKQIEAVMRDKVASIELTFNVKKHVEKRAYIDNEGDLKIHGTELPHPMFFHSPELERTLKKIRGEKDSDEVKLSVSDTAFLEIMGIFLEPLKSTRNGLIIKLKEHGIKFES